MIDSNIAKIPTVLAAAGFAVALLLGFALNPSPTFANKPDGSGNHSHGDDGGNGAEATYSVTWTGDVEGLSGNSPWIESGKLIEPTVPGDIGELTSLSFFTEDSPFGPNGQQCFGTSPIELSGAFLSRGRRGRAEGWFWFIASTFEPLPNGSVPMPKYLLKMVGTFGDALGENADWPPSPTTIMTLTDWELKVENEPEEVRNISCIGIGEGVVPFEVVITVVKDE